MSSDSSLSTPPEDLVPAAEDAAVKVSTHVRKRKATTAVHTTIKRTRKTSVPKVKLDGAILDGDQAIQPKTRVTRNTVAVEGAVEPEERKFDGGKTTSSTTNVHETDKEKTEPVIAKKAVAKRQPKSTKNAEPLTERTEGSKLCVGAHVSAAGGKSQTSLSYYSISEHRSNAVG